MLETNRFDEKINSNMMFMRKRIYEIIEVSDGKNILSSIYDLFMIIAIIASLIPLAFKTEYLTFKVVDKICVIIFIMDYILRLITADFKYNKSSVTAV